ncbi:hypothetical protein BGX38DRAFT_200094 [Terfezia claveryi]|nr:hypothetical protein BGX38DRAFT_200094 [Terfezia claveryi]
MLVHITYLQYSSQSSNFLSVVKNPLHKLQTACSHGGRVSKTFRGWHEYSCFLQSIMTLSLIQESLLPRTPEPEYPLPPVPSGNAHLPSVSYFSLEAYQVIQKERRRQMRIEQGIARGIESSVHPQVLLSGVESASLDSLIFPGSGGGTPRQRFCLVDLVDDSDAIYGRMQWANECENPELSVSQRQRHADQLALRFLQHTACDQSRPFMPSQTAVQERQPLKLPELHHPYGFLSEDSATEQRGRTNGVVREFEGGNDEGPNDAAQKENA